ncbi:MAG: class I tRNA ligase family protein, partial [bacterium]
RGQPDGWKKYWTGDARLLHFIGKDNIVFHCLIFPAMLKAYGEFVLPENVPANEFLNLEGDKISTSRNWAVWLHEYLEEFPGKQDVLRYVLCSTAPENKDNDFTWKDFQARNNNELVAILGNFVNRTLVLTEKYYDGKVPAPGKPNKDDDACIKEIKEAPVRIKDLVLNFRLRESLFELMNLARTGNKYLADQEPWKIHAPDPERVKTILYVSLEITATLAYIMEPFLPDTSKKLLAMMNLSAAKWEQFHGHRILKEGHRLGKSGLLFEKIEDEIIEKQIKKLMDSKEANAIAPPIAEAKAPTTFDDFQKMDIRVGTITAAERVPKTDKLLKLTIDTGLDQRTVVSGIAKDFDLEKIIGQQVSILLNLEPRKIKGIESQGMILMAENEKGELAFVAPTKAISNGGIIK